MKMNNYSKKSMSELYSKDENRKIIAEIKTCEDPELELDIWNLGLIYDIKINQYEYSVEITHTLTSAFCPFADEIVNDIRTAGLVKGVRSIDIITTFNPPFTLESVPEETRLLMGW